MIRPLKQKNPPFVTPDAEKPDPANGPYMSFDSYEGGVAYIQMTNERAIWIKQVSSDGQAINIASFAGNCGESITNYLVQRLKDTEKH